MTEASLQRGREGERGREREGGRDREGEMCKEKGRFFDSPVVDAAFGEDRGWYDFQLLQLLESHLVTAG